VTNLKANDLLKGATAMAPANPRQASDVTYADSCVATALFASARRTACEQ